MTTHSQDRVLYVIVCSAGPAGQAGHLVQLAHDQGWTVQIIATPSALPFIDVPKLEAQTGRPVRSQYRGPGEPRSPRADAIIVAPATYNTINKWAHGISDTYALGILAEAPSLGIPVVVLPPPRMFMWAGRVKRMPKLGRADAPSDPPRSGRVPTGRVRGEGSR
jgi:phosphopantothenoylcysteine synthetase/decarboxylase